MIFISIALYDRFEIPKLGDMWYGIIPNIHLQGSASLHSIVSVLLVLKQKFYFHIIFSRRHALRHWLLDMSSKNILIKEKRYGLLTLGVNL